MARGYHVSTVGRDEQVIREYIRHQEEEDRRIDQLDFDWSLPPLGGAINNRFERFINSSLRLCRRLVTLALQAEARVHRVLHGNDSYRASSKALNTKTL